MKFTALTVLIGAAFWITAAIVMDSSIGGIAHPLTMIAGVVAEVTANLPSAS